MDYSVYNFANDNVETLPWRRQDEAYAANGSAAKAWSLSQKTSEITQKDIANKEVRPDVWVAVNKNVSPAANYRSPKPPTIDNFEPYKGAAPAPEFANPGWKEPAPAADI